MSNILFEVRNLPPSAFALPSDGKKQKHLTRLRRSLAMQLASYANKDGSSIRPHVRTMAGAIGVSVRTTQRLLDDLERLGVLQNGEITKGRARLRKLDVTPLRPAELSLPNMHAPLPDRAGPAPDTPRPLPNSFGTQTLPRDLPAGPTPLPKPEKADGGWEEDFFIQDRIYNRLDAMPDGVRKWLKEQTLRRGFPIIKSAVDLFLRESFDGAKAPWMLFRSKAESLFAKARQLSRTEPGWRQRYVPGAREEADRLQEESIKRQTQELLEKRMRRDKAREENENTADISELFG
jgi:Helix-turn-helix domain